MTTVEEVTFVFHSLTGAGVMRVFRIEARRRAKNKRIIIGDPLPLVTDQRPRRNNPLQIACWLTLQTLQLRAERCIR